MLFDIISLIIIIISLIIGFKTGAAKVIGRLFSLVISFLCAVFLSHILASFIYTTFIQAAVINNITEVANNSALTTASQKASELLSGFPIIFANIMSYFNNDGVCDNELCYRCGNIESCKKERKERCF